MTRYYMPPVELLPVQCPVEAGREEAVAALLEVASLVRRQAYATLTVGLVGAVAVLVSLAIFSLTPFWGFFRLLAIAFTLIFILFIAFTLVQARRRLRLARLLEEAALLVERGLLEPGRVCGSSIGAVARMVEARGSVKGV